MSTKQTAFQSRFLSLKKRLISAAILAPVLISALLYGGWPFTVLIVVLVTLATYEWTKLAFKTPYRLGLSVLGFVYIGVTFLSCYWLRDQYGAVLSLMFLIMVWAGDIGAYFTGKLIGGPKMLVRISPNKTWAGFVGAVVFPGLAGLVYIAIVSSFVDLAVPSVEVLNMVLVVLSAGVVIGFLGQIGDLLVSSLKRLAHVKNASELIPGHGGVLDRADSVMLPAPVILILVMHYHAFFGL